MFGGGGPSGDPSTLFFTDGINGETDGLFGALTVPEPSTWAMMLVGFGSLALFAARRHRLSDAPLEVGSSRVDLQACKLEYSIVSPK